MAAQTSSPQTARNSTFVRLEADQPAPRARQVALVPGVLAPTLQLSLPAGLRGQAREQVARRQVQDQLGLGTDRVEIHPLTGAARGGSDTWSRVMVTDPALLRGWRTAAGTACRALLPDYMGLPTAPDIWTLAAGAGVLSARLGPADGFSADSALALPLLERSLAEGNAPKAALLLGKTPLPEIEALLSRHDIPLLDSAKDAAKLGLAVPQVLAHGELAHDLRRDPRAAKARLRRRVLPWRWPVLVGLVAAGLWGATLWIETRQITTQTRAIQDQTQTLVRRYFVPEGPILDVRTQVLRALAARSTPAEETPAEISQWPLFGALGAVLAHEPATPVRISATPLQGLQAELELADFAAADALVASLRDAGLTPRDVQSQVVSGRPGVRTTLRLEPAEDSQ